MCTQRGGSVCGSCSTSKHFFHGLGACDLCWLAVCPRLIPKRFSFMYLWYSILYSIANYELLRCLGYDKWHREVEWNFSRCQLKLCQKFCLKCVFGPKWLRQRQQHFCQFEYFMTFVTLCMQQTLVSCLQTVVNDTASSWILFFFFFGPTCWAFHPSAWLAFSYGLLPSFLLVFSTYSACQLRKLNLPK